MIQDATVCEVDEIELIKDLIRDDRQHSKAFE
jgi:hypothetical protein